MRWRKGRRRRRWTESFVRFKLGRSVNELSFLPSTTNRAAPPDPPPPPPSTPVKYGRTTAQSIQCLFKLVESWNALLEHFLWEFRMAAALPPNNAVGIERDACSCFGMYL